MIPVQLMLLHLEGYNYSVFDLTRRDRVQIQVTSGNYYFVFSLFPYFFGFLIKMEALSHHILSRLKTVLLVLPNFIDSWRLMSS